MKLNNSLNCILLLTALLAFPGNPVRAGEIWTDGQDASLVLGTATFTSSTIGTGPEDLNHCSGIATDPATGKVFVTDTANHRVLRYDSFENLSNGGDAEAVFGQADFGTGASGLSVSAMNIPFGLTVGPDGELWVVDQTNNRVLRFDNAATASSGADADGVLGQSDFSTSTVGAGTTGLNEPHDVAVNSDGVLFILDTDNNRVLVFTDAVNKSDGAAADAVLGQPDFATTDPDTSQSTLRYARGIAVDSNGTLFVSDQSNKRIMIFDDAGNLSSGSNADRQIGQPDFDTSTAGTDDWSFDSIDGIDIGTDGSLYVCDNSNARILIFENAASLSGVSTPDNVLGQPDFAGTSSNRTAAGFIGPNDVAIDNAGNLWMADVTGRRVLAFEKFILQPDLTVGSSASELKGDDVYNANAAGQRKSIRTDGRKVKVYCTIGNDGTIDEAYTLQGKGTTRRFKVKTWLISGGRTNVTSAVKNGIHSTTELANGESLRYRIEVTPKGRTRSQRANFNAWLRASSPTDGEVDKVIGRIQNRP